MQDEYIRALIAVAIIIGIGLGIYLLVYFLLFKRRGGRPSRVNFFWGLFIGLMSIRYFIFLGPQGIIFKPLDFIVFLIGGYIIVKICDFYLIERKIETGEITFPSKWHKAIRRLSYCLLAFISALIMWKGDFLPWFVLFGIVVIVVTVALQDWLQSAVNGLQWGKLFEVGNWLVVGDKEGKVVEVNLQGLKLQTEDFNSLFIPSAVLAKEKVIDYGLSTQRHNCVVEMDVNSSVPPDKVKELLVQGISEIQGVSKLPSPQVLIISFGNLWIKYKLTFWIENFSERRKIISKAYNLIWYYFKREEIENPALVYDIYAHIISPEEKARKKSQEILYKKEILKRIRFLSVFTEEALAKVVEKSKKRLFLKGETIVKQDQKGDFLFIVLSGKINLSSKKKGLNKEFFSTCLGPGDFFGEMSVFIDEESLSTITIEERSECLLLDRESIKNGLITNAAIVQPISEILAEIQAHQKERIEKELDKVENIVSMDQRIKNIALKIKEVFKILQ